MKTAYNHALEALSRRARSGVELSRWLRERDWPADDITDVIERLTASGLLDDAKYAAQFARSRILDRKLSKRRVLGELGRRGVAKETAAAAVAELIEEEGVDEEAAVEAIAVRKARSLAKLDRQTAARRLMGFLARRGYDGDVVRRVTKKVLSA